METENEILIPEKPIEFPPNLLKLQELVASFITFSILNQETIIYKFLQKESLINMTLVHMEMIAVTKENFYNQYLIKIMNKQESITYQKIMDIIEFIDYEPHILLKKMFAIETYIHFNLNMTNSKIDTIDEYCEYILEQINHYYSKNSLLPKLQKTEDDNEPFPISKKENFFEVIFNISDESESD